MSKKADAKIQLGILIYKTSLTSDLIDMIAE
jgi:hypothetical protein